MKNIGAKVLILLVLLIYIPTLALAHPGNTDGSGGHTCRTNCTEKWGLNYGEYHYHDGGGSTAYETSYNAQAEWDNGYNAGYKIGYELGYKKAYDETVEYSYNTPEYKDG